MNPFTLIERLRQAEAVYQQAHELAEHIYREQGKGAEHGAAVAARDRAESAVKSLRAECYIVAAATAERAALIASGVPTYLRPGGLAPVMDDDASTLPF